VNATDLAKTAYSAKTAPTRTLRGTEYEIFARITHRLKAAASVPSSGFAAMARALHDNRDLWAMLAEDVAGEDNALPVSLRQQILSLAEFTKQHSRRILAGDAKADVLIDINTAIMRGLRQETPARDGGTA